MSKMIRMILIDSEKKEVTEFAAHPGASLEAMQQSVKGMIERATQLPNGDDVYVDEEGLFKGYKSGFVLPGIGHQPFIGNGVVAGCNVEGDTISAKSSLDVLRKQIKFIDIKGEAS